MQRNNRDSVFTSRRPSRSAWAALLLFAIVTTAAFAVTALWTRKINGSADGDDRGWEVALSPDGNLYAIGRVEVAGEGHNIWIRKYDSAGTKLWTRNIDGPASGNDYGYSAAVDSAGKLYVGGCVDVPGEGRNIWIRKYNASGVKVWTRMANGPADLSDCAYRVAVDTAGDLLVAGYKTISSDNLDIWMRKYSPSGAKLWTRTVDGPVSGYDRAYGLATDSAKNVFVTGSVEVAAFDSDIWIRKYSSTGVKRWTRMVDGPEGGRDASEGAAVDADGNLYAVGHVRVTDQVSNIWIRKYSPSGAKLWTRVVDGPAHDWDEAYDAAVGANGALYVTGLWNSTSVWLRKYNSDGVKRWNSTYSGPYGFAQGNGIAVDDSARIYVTGIIEGPNNNLDIWIRKYQQ